MIEHATYFSHSAIERAGYAPKSLDAAWLSHEIKGVVRRRYARHALRQLRYDILFPDLLREGLPARTLRAFAALHPDFVLGEYLPDLLPRETEIARLEIHGSLPNVISFRVRPLDREHIAYRIVDDYHAVRRTTVEFFTGGKRHLRLNGKAITAMCDAILACTEHESFHFDSNYYPYAAERLEKLVAERRERHDASAEADRPEMGDGEAGRSNVPSNERRSRLPRSVEEFIAFRFLATPETAKAYQDRTSITEAEAETAIKELRARNSSPGLLFFAMECDTPVTEAATRAFIRLWSGLMWPRPEPVNPRPGFSSRTMTAEFLWWMFKGVHWSLRCATASMRWIGGRTA